MVNQTSKPDGSKRAAGRTWTLKVRVSQNWIDDGFDMTEDRCRQIAEELLPYANDDEVTVKVSR